MERMNFVIEEPSGDGTTNGPSQPLISQAEIRQRKAAMSAEGSSFRPNAKTAKVTPNTEQKSVPERVSPLPMAIDLLEAARKAAKKSREGEQ